MQHSLYNKVVSLCARSHTFGDSPVIGMLIFLKEVFTAVLIGVLAMSLLAMFLLLVGYLIVWIVFFLESLYELITTHVPER